MSQARRQLPHFQLAVVLLSLLSPPCSGETWRAIAREPGGTTRSIDADSVRRAGVSIEYWIRAADGNLEYVLADCNSRMRQIRDQPGERPKAGSIDEVELNAACRLAKSLPPLQGISSVEPSSRERPSREEVSAERQSYRLKVEAFDSTKRELTGIVLEQTQMQPGVFVDAGSSIRQGFPASVKHNPAELKPGVIVVVTEVWRDGLWEIESVRRAQK